LSEDKSTPDVESKKVAREAVESVSRIPTIPAVLKAVADLTGMRYVVIARVTDERWIACAVLDNMEFGLPEGGELEVASTLCSEVRDHRQAIVIGHASEDGIYCGHPTPKKYGIESYIAVPITLRNGDFFGTLCAVDSLPADLSNKAIVKSMELFAELVATELGSEETYIALVASESKRRESANRVRAVTDAMPGLISYIDSQYRYQFVNRAYTEWFQLSAREIVGKPIWKVLGSETFNGLKPHLDTALAGNTEVFETEMSYPVAGTRFIRASYTPDILDDEVRGIFVLVVDITEERRAQDAVRRSEERYRAFIQHSTEAIWRFELEEPIPIDLPATEQVLRAYQFGYLAECNDAMARQYGFTSAAEIVGTRLTDLLVVDDPKNVEFIANFVNSGYKILEAESHERDANGNDRYFLNNFVGIVENGFLLRAWGTQRDVTKAKLADDATARLAAIVVSSEDAIIGKDLSGNITSWNIGATKMFGYRADEVVGKAVTTLIPPDRVDESVEILRKIRREENVEQFETVRRHKDGSDLIVSLTVSPIRNADGNVIGASKIVRDITERRRIEESINQNQAMLTLAMQSSRMGVWELDIRTNTVSWSEELEEIFGLEKGSFGGSQEHFFALVHEDDREAVWAEIQSAIAERSRYVIEFRFYHSDGTTRWMEGRGEAVYSQKGEPIRLYGVGIDITDRKESERALRESEQRFSRFMQHLPGLAWIKDVEGRYVYANESAEKAFGVSGDRLYGKTDEEIFPAETAEQFRAHDRRAVDTGGGIQITESLIEDDGVLHHSIVSKFPIAGADGSAYMIGGMAIDVTDQKQAEEALRQRMDFDEAVMRNMAEGLYTVDASGLVTSINPAAEKLFGWTFEELKGRKMHDVTHYKRRDGSAFPADECAGLSVLRDGRSLVDHEDVFIRRDGTFFDVLYSSSPLREHDQIVGLVVVFTDITERKRAETRLALQEEIGELIRTVATPSELMYAVASAVGGNLRVKRALFNEIDLDKDRETVHRDFCADGVQSVAGVHPISAYSPVTSGEMQDGRTIVNSDSKVDPRTADHYELSYEPNGERAYVAVPLLRNGTWVASLWVSDDEPREWDKQDVSLLETIAERTWAAVEKMRIDAALRESQERFAKAFSSSPLVFTLSSLSNGRLVEVNDTFVEVTGYSRDEAIGKTSVELGLWTNEGDRDEELDSVRKFGHVRNLEYSFRTRNGTEIIGLLSAERVDIGGEPFALSVIQDITARKKAEDVLVQSSQFNQDVIDSIGAHIAVVDEHGVITAVNSAWQQFATENGADWTMQGVGVGANYLEVCRGADGPFADEAPLIYEGIKGVLAGSAPYFSIEYPCHSPTVERWFLLTVTPLTRTRGGAVVSHQNITERRLAELKIRESEARFRNMADHAPVMIWVTDPIGYCTYLSESWYEFTGQTPETGLGFGWLTAVHPEDVGESERCFREALQKSEPFSIEYRLRRADGTYRWAIDSAQPRLSESGEFLGYIGSVIDIDERKEAEVALRRYQERFDIVKDAAQVGFWFCDLPFDKLVWDTKVKEHFFFPPNAEVTIDKFYEGLHPDDRERTRRAIERSIEKKNPYVIEYRTVGPEGQTNWIRAIGRTFYDENGEPQRFDGVTLDITQLKKDQEALITAERKAAEEYQALLSRIVPLAGVLGRARDLNSIYRAVREFICASMTCSGFFVSFFEPETSMRHAAYVWGEGEEVDISELPPMRLTSTGGGANSRAVFEKRTIITNNYWEDMRKRPHVVLRHNGRDPLSSLIVPMMVKDNVLGTLEVQAHENEAFQQEHAVALEMAANLAAVAIENVRLIETEAAMREAAEAANRAKDEFLSVLSHELRTPLNAMLGWVRMLKAGVLDEENSERALEVIERNTRLQSSLIEDLLDVSRIISGKMRIETELVDLVSIVETVSETIRPLADAKDINYSFASEDDAVFLTADSVRMQQVVSNLLQNAIKFTPASGSVKVSINRVDSTAVLSVEDTGVGIAADLLPFIFDRFRQADASAKRNFTGLGLGLTIVRNIVELHGGSVDVRSDGKDKGSTFILTLPLAADFYEHLGLPTGRQEPGKGSLAGKSILLVDDDAENLVPLKIFLENEMAAVTPAENAMEALRHLSAREFNLLITDIGMPEMDGYELVARIRANNGRHADLKVIALTAYASVDDRERAQDSTLISQNPSTMTSFLRRSKKYHGTGDRF
jgi:PAS domain S-box-containing protein